jgi:hypothetical protein
MKKKIPKIAPIPNKISSMLPIKARIKPMFAKVREIFFHLQKPRSLNRLSYLAGYSVLKRLWLMHSNMETQFLGGSFGDRNLQLGNREMAQV